MDLIEIQKLNICSLNAKGKYAMTDTEIETYRQELNTLTNQCSNEDQEKEIRSQLQDLARKVGASRLSVCVFSEGAQIKSADTSILIHNIHQALQTATMVNMCRTATRGYKIAFLSAVAAIFSAVAACVLATYTLIS